MQDALEVQKETMEGLAEGFKPYQNLPEDNKDKDNNKTEN